MKTIINKFILIALCGILSISCSDFLDKESPSYASDGFYTTEAGIRDGVTGIYSLLYINLNWDVPFPSVLDLYTPLGLENVQNTSIGAGGGLIPSNGTVSTWWSSLYSLIARANTVIYGSSKVIDSMNDETKQYIAEARLLRAYGYYHLISTYGDVPFFTAPVTEDQYAVGRTSKVEILNFIINEMEDIANYLPWTATQRGRVDKAVAYGLEARAGLLGGSLNYGNEGNKYFRIAADAANKVIGKRGLAENFSDLFNLNGQAKSDTRNELLWELMYSNSSTKRIHRTGYGNSSRNYGSSVRYASLMLADTYECIDGNRIDESPLYDPKHPSQNRDPRFSVTLRTHGDEVEFYTTAGVNKLILEAYSEETQRYSQASEWYTITNQDVIGSGAGASFVNAGAGYLWYKYAHSVAEDISTQSTNISLMRYAEILLTYAEAKIELGELDQSVYDAIDAVRNRAGMPGVSNDRKGDQDKMRQLARRERKVELIMEGLHFIDIKRWGIGDIANGSPSYGAPLPTITYEGLEPADIPNFKTDARHDLNDIPSYDSFKHKLKVRDVNRYWKDKFALWPIPQDVIDKVPSLKQNDGY